MQRDIKLIVLDLDGTLLHTDKSISARTIAALAEARSKGILVAIATGRSHKALGGFVDAIKPDAVISCGGAVGEMNGKYFFVRQMSPSQCRALIEALASRPHTMELSLETIDNYYLTLRHAVDDIDRVFSKYYDINRPVDFECAKISVFNACPPEVYEVAAHFPSLSFAAFTGEDWYCFTHAQAHKMTAIAALAQRVGMPMESVAAFGDDHNDISMLAGCGLGVAMANAIPQAKAVADEVTLSNDEDGVALFMEKFLL